MKDLSEQLGISEAIKNRKSCRASLNQDVSLDIIEQILKAARWAPSGVNHQPTQIAVLGKETKSKLAKLLVEKHSNGIPPSPDLFQFQDLELKDKKLLIQYREPFKMIKDASLSGKRPRICPTAERSRTNFSKE